MWECHIRQLFSISLSQGLPDDEAVEYACRRVQNLFHSVSLNVNNPHFLIMQGRITKVRCASCCAISRTAPVSRFHSRREGVSKAL